MYAQYGDRVGFYVVYLREAHTEDGRQSPANRRDEIVVNQPKTYDERVDLAQQMCSKLELTIPCLIDGMDNRVGLAYAAHPDRMYVIGIDGTVAYMGAKGPQGFNPRQVRDFLEYYLLLLDAAGVSTQPVKGPDAKK
jgi:hypothetical protein